MPSARAELEAALRQRIDRDVLSVYADVLQAEGDSRGEQIALEMRTADAARFELFELWLRAELAQRAGEVAHPHLFVVDRRDAEWLAGPLGEFARGVSIVARAPEVREVLAAIAARPRPYFRRAKLLAGFETVVLSDELVAATPNLEELELEGAFDLSELVHPTLRTLRRSIRSTEGGAALLRPLYLPAVTHLDLELNPWPDAVEEKRFTCEHLPALLALDLARCEPRYGRYDGFHMLDVLGWLRTLPLRHQLRELRLPSLRSQRAADHVAALLGENPRLAVTVVRAYTRFPFGAELAPPVTLPLAWPWIPEDMVTKETWDVTFDFAGGDTFKVIVSAVSGRLEQLDYAGFAPELRADWEQVCAALDAAARGKKTKLPCALLARTVGTFTSGSEYDTATDIGKRVVAAAARVAPDALVTLRK